MKRLLAAACGLALGAILAGCGSATDHLSFKAPAGFESKFNMLGQEMWMKGDKNNPELLVLSKIPMKMNDAKFSDFNATDIPTGSLKNGKVSEAKKIAICGNHPAMLVRATGNDAKSGKAMDMDMLMTGWGGSTYFAMYMHPSGTAPDAGAEAALKNLCQA